MRKITLAFAATIALMFSANQVRAQHDVKLNFLSFLFNQYGIGYENVLNEQMGLGATANLYTQKEGGEKYVGWNIAPEFRFYFSPDDDAEGFYAGPYLKYRSIKYTDDFQDDDFTNTGVALGLGLGRKWVADAGFLFETYLGIGKYLVNNYKFTENDSYEDVTDYLPDIDIRVGLIIGWRF